MKPGELEQRRRALEKQLEEDLELVRAAHEVKLRALERLAEPTPEESRPASPPPPASSAQVTTPGSVRRDLEAALDTLPPVFDRADIYRALGYEPPRTTLGRALDELMAGKKIKLDRLSGGGYRTRYRKV